MIAVAGHPPMGSTTYERELSTLPMLLWSMALVYSSWVCCWLVSGVVGVFGGHLMTRTTGHCILHIYMHEMYYVITLIQQFVFVPFKSELI